MTICIATGLRGWNAASATISPTSRQQESSPPEKAIDELSVGFRSTEPDTTHVFAGISIADAISDIAETIAGSILIASPFATPALHSGAFSKPSKSGLHGASRLLACPILRFDPLPGGERGTPEILLKRCGCRVGLLCRQNPRMELPFVVYEVASLCLGAI